MSQLVDFYRGDGVDRDGRRFDDILTWPDEEWEMCHDFIQWVFPLREPSQFNRHAPLLTDEDIATFRADPRLQARLRSACERFLAFLGLRLVEDEGRLFVMTSENSQRDVWAYPNHNWLRVTRVLLSLKTLGQAPLARALFTFLETQRWRVTAETFQYWSEALAEH